MSWPGTSLRDKKQTPASAAQIHGFRLPGLHTGSVGTTADRNPFGPPARERAGLDPAARARIELRRWPARADRLIAEAAGTEAATVTGARRQLEREGQIPAIPWPMRTEWKPYERPGRLCERCGVAFTPLPRRRKGGRPQRFCSDACCAAAYNERRREQRRQMAATRQPQRVQYTRKIAPRPDFTGARCATGPADKRALWTSGHPADREAARHMCNAVCPCLEACRAWALTLPDHDYAVYGGLSWSDRIEAKYADPAAWDRRCRELGI